MKDGLQITNRAVKDGIFDSKRHFKTETTVPTGELDANSVLSAKLKNMQCDRNKESSKPFLLLEGNNIFVDEETNLKSCHSTTASHNHFHQSFMFKIQRQLDKLC